MPNENRLNRASLSLLSLLALASPLAARSRDPDPIAAVGGCALCSTVLLIPVVIIALNFALLVWVARDAKARGMDSAMLWMILVMVTSVVGLALYIFSRPQGNVVQCSNCHNKRLQASVKCPHCGAA